MLELLASTLRMSTPLLFAALGGILCERTGIATICLEGVMLMSAWTAAAVCYFTHSPYLGLIAGIIAGVLTMGLHALLSVSARADQIVSGVAVNMIAAGLTPVLNMSFFGSPTSSPTIPTAERFPAEPLLWLALSLPFLVHWLLYRTAWGLRIVAAGDGPEALRTSGVSPAKVRYASMCLGGALTALGGIYLSTAHGSEFTRDMTAGRGYIALAALIFGKWKPLPAAASCLLFGFADALQIQLQSAVVFGYQIPVQFIQALPYAVTLLVLVGFIGKARPPLSIGRVVDA